MCLGHLLTRPYKRPFPNQTDPTRGNEIEAKLKSGRKKGGEGRPCCAHTVHGELNFSLGAQNAQWTEYVPNHGGAPQPKAAPCPARITFTTCTYPQRQLRHWRIFALILRICGMLFHNELQKSIDQPGSQVSPMQASGAAGKAKQRGLKAKKAETALSRLDERYIDKAT